MKTRKIFQKLVNGNSPDVSPLRPGIGRREAVQWLIAGPVVRGLSLGLPAYKHLSGGATIGGDAKTDSAEWTPEFLDVHQNESLIALAERMIPGSTKAQVNRFIDLLLTVDTQESKEHFLGSLGAFEAESRSRFGHPFRGLTEDQQTQIFTAASVGEPGNAPASEDWQWFSIPTHPPSEPIRITLRDHFENLKGWITRAYYSSETGMRDLGWTGQYFYEVFPGCEDPNGHSVS